MERILAESVLLRRWVVLKGTTIASTMAGSATAEQFRNGGTRKLDKSNPSQPTPPRTCAPRSRSQPASTLKNYRSSRSDIFTTTIPWWIRSSAIRSSKFPPGYTTISATTFCQHAAPGKAQRPLPPTCFAKRWPRLEESPHRHPR
jgi:hypothetical protein